MKEQIIILLLNENMDLILQKFKEKNIECGISCNNMIWINLNQILSKI